MTEPKRYEARYLGETSDQVPVYGVFDKIFNCYVNYKEQIMGRWERMGFLSKEAADRVAMELQTNEQRMG